MYTKEPSREKGSLVGLSYGSYDSNTLKALTTGTVGDLDYLLYANKTEVNGKSLYNQGSEIQRDSQNLNIYTMLKKVKWKKMKKRLYIRILFFLV